MPHPWSSIPVLDALAAGRAAEVRWRLRTVTLGWRKAWVTMGWRLQPHALAVYHEVLEKASDPSASLDIFVELLAHLPTDPVSASLAGNLLEEAAAAGHLPQLAALLAHLPDPTALDAIERALETAALNQQPQAMDILLQAPYLVRPFGYDAALAAATESVSPACLTVLLRHHTPSQARLDRMLGPLVDHAEKACIQAVRATLPASRQAWFTDSPSDLAASVRALLATTPTATPFSPLGVPFLPSANDPLTPGPGLAQS